MRHSSGVLFARCGCESYLVRNFLKKKNKMKSATLFQDSNSTNDR